MLKNYRPKNVKPMHQLMYIFNFFTVQPSALFITCSTGENVFFVDITVKSGKGYSFMSIKCLPFSNV